MLMAGGINIFTLCVTQNAPVSLPFGCVPSTSCASKPPPDSLPVPSAQHPWEAVLEAEATLFPALDRVQLPCAYAPPAGVPPSVFTPPASALNSAWWPGMEAYNRTLCVMWCGMSLRYNDAEVLEK